MANFIHSTAIVHPTALLGDRNHIGPYCIIGPNVKIGNGNIFVSHVSIGSPPEHKGYWHNKYESVIIGNDCRFSEFVTVNCGTMEDTIIMNDVNILAKSHVGHDAFIDDHVTISCFACVGGHSSVLRGANLGLHSVIHQNCVVGHYAMLGMGCVVTKKSQIVPGYTYVGNPARQLKKNDRGLSLFKIDDRKYFDTCNEYQEELKCLK